MRVLLLTQIFPPEPDLKALPLARELETRGHEVEVLTGFPNYPGGEIYDGYRLRWRQEENLAGIRVTRIPLYPSHNKNGLLRALNYLSFGGASATLGPWLKRRPDVVWVYNLITLLPAAALFRAVWGSRVVLEVQDLWPQSVQSSGMMSSPTALKILEDWCKVSYRLPDHLLVQTPGFKEYLAGQGVPSDQIDVVYNWAPETGRMPPRPRAPGAPFRVLFAGTMGVMQALDVVVGAAQRLKDKAPDVRFSLLGSGVDEARLRSMAEGLPNVEFLPRCSAADVGGHLAAADALLVHLKTDPVFRITIPSKVQAYLYAGKPILCGVEGDAAELVNRAGAGLSFRPEDPDDLARAVLELRRLPVRELENIGKSGERFYGEVLSQREGVDRIEAVFRRVAGDREH